MLVQPACDPMTTSIEREIKLRFESTEDARRSVASLDATPLRARRLQDDRLLDWPDGRLREARCVLRVRHEGDSAMLTFKGPTRPAAMKVREELETEVGDATLLVRLLERLGLRVWFRYQKYREEFEYHGVVVAIDETPIGTFVELEGNEHGIVQITHDLGRTHEDYVVDSYRGFFAQARAAGEVATTDMLFDLQP